MDNRKNKKKVTRKQRQKRKIIFTIIALVLMLLLLGVAFIFGKFGMMEKIKLGNLKFNQDLDAKALKGYTTFALFGLDNRSSGSFESGNSDTMIIVSLNNKTDEIKMASLYRDTYLDIDENKFRKANAAYMNGGPEQAINMMNKNLDLNISDYVAVDFNALVKVIDLLGGVDIEVTEEEAGIMPMYITEINGVLDKNSGNVGAGLQTLDGVQATAYARIRYTEGWDYKRTERQRTVVTKMFEKAKVAKLTTLNSVLDAALPDVSTSMGNAEMLGLMTKVGKLNMGENAGFPFDKTSATVGNLGSVVIAIDLAENVRQLHAFLYNDEDYTVSNTVQTLSDTIYNELGY